MISIERNALLLYSTEQVFDLINDVATYPYYMDGCVGAEVLSESPTEMLARLDLAKKNVRISITTRNFLERPYRVKMELVDGPFSAFDGCWQIQPLNESACKVSIRLSFRLKSQLLKRPMRLLLNSMADNLVDALTKRARAVYESPANRNT